MHMKNRKNYLKARQKQFKWTQFGYRAIDYPCPNCGADTMIFFDQYDAWACMSCLEWAEPACGEPSCPFCRIRPKNPYEAYHLNDTEAMSAERKKRWRRDNYQHKTDGMHKHHTKKQYYHTLKEAKE